MRKDLAKHQAALKALPDKGPPHFGTDPDMPVPTCDTKSVSEVPNNVFNPTVFSKFCDEVNQNKGQSHSSNVASDGNKIPPKAAKNAVDASQPGPSGSARSEQTAVRKRTPPPNPDKFSGWAFGLIWTGGDGKCKSDCGSAFSAMAVSQCGHQGGQSNVMANSAKLDTGCGTYSYTITAPPGHQVVGQLPKPGPPKALSCAPDYLQNYRKFSRDKAAFGIEIGCERLVVDKWVLGGKASDFGPVKDVAWKKAAVQRGDDIAEKNAYLSIQPRWNVDACEDKTQLKMVDFFRMGEEECRKRFLTALDSCECLCSPLQSLHYQLLLMPR